MQNLLATIATLGPVGMLPAPGTAGSFTALIIAAGITHQAGMMGLVAALVLITIIAFPAITAYTRKTGIHDAGPVVIDEVIGQWLPLLLLPPFSMTTASFVTYGLTFVLFRVFDVLKPGPIRRAEALPGSAGVIADDVLAGVAAGIAMALGLTMWGGM
jgi:phosphatidylglycerophosphatase A